MNHRTPAIIFIAFLALGMAFVWSTSSELPPVVASHFGASGSADGFTPRSSYVGIMLVLLGAVALLIGFLPFVLTRQGGAGLNLPNRQYWLAPERREETFRFLRLHGLVFASLFVAFFAYVHWLVVQANQLTPPLLSTSAIITALVVFFTGVAALLGAVYARFRKRA
jgi:uncharacterized membrane protein